jgi:hypothetical protein
LETNQVQEKTGQNGKKTDYFSHIGAIGEIISQAGGMNDLFWEFAEPHLDVLSGYLQMEKTTTALLAVLVNLYNGRDIEITRIANYLKLKLIEVIQFIDEFEKLEQRELIMICRERHGPLYSSSEMLEIKLKFMTIEVLKKGNFHEIFQHKNLSIDRFFMQLDRFYEDNIHERVSYKNTHRKVMDLLQNNVHLCFVQKIQNLNLPDDDILVLLRFFHYLVNKNEPDMTFQKLFYAIYDYTSDFTSLKRQLKNGSYILLKEGLIENICEDGFSNTQTFCLTDKAKDEFLVELDVSLKEVPIKNLKRSDSINAKNLFYPEKTQQAIAELCSLLQPDHFLDVQKRLSENSMRTGFACLFSGGPGTGKTETALQIARIAGRDIMQVDIASTKSKWFGESEKQIKALFDKYRSCVKKCVITPILLFNEADAVFGKRRLLGETRNGPDQTENTIQNIILQEIENLNGILIATTNLSTNMDTAFERRFLYKIEFDKPETETRKAIWTSLIVGLSDEDAWTLASRFDFSGGQIENIARKSTVHHVLSGKTPILDDMIKFCTEECLTKEKKIGFAA